MTHRVTDQAAFILRRRDWRNTSLILDVLTREQGYISLLAKGARRSRNPGNYQPFALLSIGWSGQQELKTLNGIEARTLPIHEANYLSLLYVNELVAAFLPRQEANPEVFDAYLALLHQAAKRMDEAPLRQFEIVLLQTLGYFPDITLDADSGEPIGVHGHYQYLMGSGFVACSADARDAVAGRVILHWVAGFYQHSEVMHLARTVLRSTIDFNLHGKKLKSREVYARIQEQR